MRIRSATTDDLDGLLALYRELQPDDPVLPAARAAESLSEILDRPGLTLFVGEDDDGSLVASTYLDVVPNLTRGARPYAVIENVIVAKHRRSTGRGTQIMAHTVAAAEKAGCYKVMLLTGSTNPATHAFYRGCGFDGDTKHAYQLRFPRS